MFVKTKNGDFVNILNAIFIDVLEKNAVGNSIVYAYFLKDSGMARNAANDQLETRMLFSGKYDKCQAYMTELEKELKAYGKLILVEVKPEIKCTCGNGGKQVWDHAENCPVYAPF